MKYCCEQFESKANRESRDYLFEPYNGAWVINGCCGGGCFVVSNMKYCPYCGVELKELSTPSS